MAKKNLLCTEFLHCTSSCFGRINWCSFSLAEGPVFMRISGASGGGQAPSQNVCYSCGNHHVAFRRHKADSECLLCLLKGICLICLEISSSCSMRRRNCNKKTSPKWHSFEVTLASVMVESQWSKAESILVEGALTHAMM